MSTDTTIIDRLRAHANAPTRYEDVGPVEYDCLLAAQEIERLTAALTAALATLARDLETARQARDAANKALADCVSALDSRVHAASREELAAVRAARAETWAEAALLAGQSATAIRNLRQAFVASPVMGELAVVRAEALEQFAKALNDHATAAREGQ